MFMMKFFSGCAASRDFGQAVQWFGRDSEKSAR
jgi:hypothetical protein